MPKLAQVRRAYMRVVMIATAARRVAAQMDKPLVYDSAFESLKRALGPKLDAAALERFRALGVHFDRKLDAA